MEALETYTSAVAVLSAAVLLIAAGLAKKRLVWKRSEACPGTTGPSPFLKVDVDAAGGQHVPNRRRLTRVAPRSSGRGRDSR